MRFFVTFFAVILSLNIFSSQTKIDSLQIELKKAEGKEKVDILNSLTGELIYDQPSTALDYGNQALKLAETLNYEKGKVTAYMRIGGGYFISDNYLEAIESYSKALKIYESRADEFQISKCLNNIGDSYYYLNDLEQALDFFQRSLRIKEKLGAKSGTARTLHNIGKIYKNQGDYEKALDFLYHALQIREEIKDKKRIAFTLNEIGNVFSSMSNYEKTLEFYLKSLKIKEEIGDKRGTAITLNNIGNVHSDIGNEDKALEYYQKSLKIQKEINNRSGIAYSLLTIGQIYSHNKDYATALEYYKRALLIRKEIGDKKGIADLLGAIGNIYFYKNDMETALAHYLKAKKLQTEINSKNGLASTYKDLGDVFFKLENIEKALNYYLESIKFAREINSSELLLSGYKSISNAFYKKMNYKKAFDYFKLYAALNDSLFSDDLTKRIAEMQIKYETEKKEKEIELLTKEQEKQIQFRNFLVFISGLIFIVAMLLFYLYRLKKQENIQQKNVEEQITEINRSLEIRVQQELKKREQQQALLIQKSKLESLGRLSAGIAHELNQPVTRLSLGLDNILVRKSMHKLDDQYLDNKCNELFKDIERIRTIIEHIRTFSRDQSSSSLERIDPNEVINNSIQLIRTQYRNHDVHLHLDLSEKIGYILGNRFKLEQVVLNMLSNSKDAVDEKFDKIPESRNMKKIKIRTYAENNKINIEIEDNGLGIPDYEKEKIFDPFYTTKSTDKGTGLGLSISYGIIREMEGEISVESESGKFTKMKIKLPRI